MKFGLGVEDALQSRKSVLSICAAATSLETLFLLGKKDGIGSCERSVTNMKMHFWRGVQTDTRK